MHGPENDDDQRWNHRHGQTWQHLWATCFWQAFWCWNKVFGLLFQPTSQTLEPVTLLSHYWLGRTVHDGTPSHIHTHVKLTHMPKLLSVCGGVWWISAPQISVSVLTVRGLWLSCCFDLIEAVSQYGLIAPFLFKSTLQLKWHIFTKVLSVQQLRSWSVKEYDGKLWVYWGN